MGKGEHNHVGDEHEEKDDVISRVMKNPVFTRRDGRPFAPNDLRRQIFYKVLSLAGMSGSGSMSFAIALHPC